MPGIFVTATDARTKSRNNTVIHSEITSIENAVYANIDAGLLYANVNNSTMTNSNVYYNVKNGVTTDATKKDQLDYVTKYFKDLGYGISCVSDPSANTHLQWNISW
jgi:hypothetical protein